ncbi:MAG: CTP:phosphocholine cytidylyltransferase-like protein [Colwellia sp.]|jgi:CTP:phosphocholine cytidylyltransferase-like protein
MYQAHGKNIISVEGNIIISKITGAFNLEGVDKSIADIKVVVENFGQNEFKYLINYIDTEGATPEVYDKINQFNTWLNSQNMVAKAIVINSNVLLNIGESRIPAGSSLNGRVFDDEVNAMIWLKSQT